MKRRMVYQAAVKRAALRSARALASLEFRVVPADYVRPAEIDRYLADRYKRV